MMVIFQEKKKQRLVLECCPGYKRTANLTQCVPDCSSPPCSSHGLCVSPDTCQCEPGYGGPDCSKCKFRRAEESEVFTLVFSSLVCPEGMWGSDCSQVCPCVNGGCDPNTGACSCPAGWLGSVCDTKCPPQTFGLDCAQKCECQNNGECHHISGACQCSPGWQGALCDEPCPPGRHGFK